MQGVLSRCRWIETRSYIEEKERERRYPLNKFNEMGTLIQIAPLVATLVHDLTSTRQGIWANTRAFSTSRLFRIYMTTLLAAATMGTENALAIEASRGLQAALEPRLRSFPNGEDGAPTAWEPTGSTLGAEQILHLLAIAREVADRAGFGDHTMYAHAPAPDPPCAGVLGFSEALFFQEHVQRALPALCFRRFGFCSPMPHVDVFRGKHISPVRGDRSTKISLTINGRVADEHSLLACRELLAERLAKEDDILSRTVDEISTWKAFTYITDLGFHLGLDERQRRQLATRQLAASKMTFRMPTARLFCDLVEQGEQAAAQ
jgi:hypothetical protein